jgi:hypothetical protein
MSRLFVALVVVVLVAAAPPVRKPTPIRKTGKTKVGTLTITVMKGGGVVARRFEKPGVYAHIGGFARDGGGWFVYPVSEDEVWDYDGVDTVCGHLLHDGGYIGIGGNVNNAASLRGLRAMPEEVFSLLPERIQKVLKGNPRLTLAQWKAEHERERKEEERKREGATQRLLKFYKEKAEEAERASSEQYLNQKLKSGERELLFIRQALDELPKKRIEEERRKEEEKRLTKMREEKEKELRLLRERLEHLRKKPK